MEPHIRILYGFPRGQKAHGGSSKFSHCDVLEMLLAMIFLLKMHDINGEKLHLTLQKHISRDRILDLTLLPIDVDECTMNTDNCHEDAFCTNKIGSFNCTCNPGYEGNGTNCTDIDECTLDTHNCHDDATCKNTKGSFNCTCNSGFDGNGTHCDGKYLILLL